MNPDQHIRRDGEGSAAHARALAVSIAESPYQSAGVLAALAVAATFHPLAGIGAAVAGAAFLALRPKPTALDLLGRPPARVEAMRKEFSLLLGHDWKAGRPLVLDRFEATMHMAVFGDTGSGKTEILLGLAEQAIAHGSGILHVDAKGDASLFPKVMAIAARYGREDDVLLVDLMGLQENDTGRTSSALNPFASGGPEDLAHLVMDLVQSDSRNENEEIILRSLLKAALGYLVWLRDRGEGLDLAKVHEHLGLDFLLGLADPAGIPASDAARQGAREYLNYLPAYSPERGDRQAAAVREQHRTILNGVAPALKGIAEAYGSLFGSGNGDVDLRDAVLNRRIVVVLLPVLVKCPKETAVLGRVILASLKSVMASLISESGGALRRRAQDPGVEKPFLCVLDDVGLYSVRGLALTAARARELGFAMVYSAEDIQSLRVGGESEASSILANTVTKAYTRVDPVRRQDPFADEGEDGDLDGEADLETGSPDPDEAFPLRQDEVTKWVNRQVTENEKVQVQFGARDMLVSFRCEKFFLSANHSNPPVGERSSERSATLKSRLRPNRLLELETPAAFDGDVR
jgi:hypothetical protein